MKRLISAIVLISLTHAQTVPKRLDLDWGIEATEYYVEGKSATNAWVKWKGAQPRRYFSAAQLTGQGQRCAEEHFRIWNEYRKSHSEADRDAFMAYKKQQVPACYAYAKQTAPVLYFDFTATDNETYVLKSIEITTFGFEEYKGGGFSEQEAWYDILLSHKPGVKPYKLDHKLTFTHTGRAQLRLWSDNFVEQEGWIAPMGAYLIDIKFVFEVNGKTTQVSTGPLQIDV